MIKRNPGVWAGIFLLILSVVFLTQAAQYQYRVKSGPGPGFFPVWLSLALLVLSLLYIYESYRNQGKDVGEPLPRGAALKQVLYILGSLIVFAALLHWIGFILSSFVFLMLLLYRAYRWFISAAIAIGTTAVMYVLFVTVLGVPLPVNALGW